MNSIGMHKGARGAGAVMTALILGAGSAAADIAPADVWADWQDYLRGFGFEVSATETETADALELTDLTLTQTLPDGAGTTVFTIPQITMQDNGDGTVGIAYPEDLPIRIEQSGPETVTVDMRYLTDSMVSNVSGDAARMVYDYTADGIGIRIDSVAADGETIDLGDIAFDIEAVEGRTVMELDGGRIANQVVKSGPATYRLTMSDPEGGDLDMNGRFDTLEMSAMLNMPEGVDGADMTAALAQGFSVEGTYAFGPGASAFEIKEEGTTTSGSTSSRGGKLSVAMDADGLAYGAMSEGLVAQITTPQLPVPLSMEMEEAVFDLAFPVAKAEAPQDFGLNLLLGGVSLGDTAWALLDANGVLPRDPATIALDLEGAATILADIMDPSEMMRVEMGDEAPAELNAMTLNRLLVSLAGAELTGMGDLTFDEGLENGFGGAVGTASFKLTGANTLLDRLISLGLIDQSQAMMARMTLGSAAVPGEGEDTLVSEIELTPEGGIIANGQRLR